MLRWAVLFFIVAIIAGVMGFGGVASASASAAQILFYVFLALFVGSLLLGSAKRIDRNV
jgi:uncharacterized membrane protein YtjA (UPF0391 family)